MVWAGSEKRQRTRTIALGLIYEGQKGVAKNLASAYAWNSLAATNGQKAAKKRIPLIAKKMTDHW